MVAIVSKITKNNGEQVILKISERSRNYFRKVLFMKQFVVALPVPKILELIEPTEGYEIGHCLAIIHHNRLSGYGDPIQNNLAGDLLSYFTLKFEESLEECRHHLPINLIDQYNRQFLENFFDKRS